MTRRPYLRLASTWWRFWRWSYAAWGVEVGGGVAPAYRLGPLLFEPAGQNGKNRID